MAWVSKDVLEKFSAFLNNLEGFHNQFVKEKNKDLFSALGDVILGVEETENQKASPGIIDLLHQDAKPKEADVFMSFLLNGIWTNIFAVKSAKEGKENQEKFDAAWGNLVVEFVRFREVYQKELLNSGEKKEEINVVGKNQSSTHISTKEEMEKQAKKLFTVPVRNNTWASYFNSTWNSSWSHHRNAMIGSSALTTFGVGYAAMSAFEEFAGPMINEAIHHATKVALDNEYVFAAGFVIAGTIWGVKTMNQSKPKSTPTKQNQSEDRLQIIKIDEPKETDSLLDKEPENRWHCPRFC